MARKPMLGIWLISIYCFSKSVYELVEVIRGWLVPVTREVVLLQLQNLVPMVRRLNEGFEVSSCVAVVYALFGLILGLCLLARKKWAYVYIFLTHGLALFWYVIATYALAKIGLDPSSGILNTSIMKIEIVCGILMTAYLVQPSTILSYGFDSI